MRDILNHLKKDSKPPFKVARIHEGLGAAGKITSVAKELASTFHP